MSDKNTCEHSIRGNYCTVTYEGLTCPLCVTQANLEEAEDRIESLEGTIEEMEIEMDNVQEELTEAKEDTDSEDRIEELEDEVSNLEDQIKELEFAKTGIGKYQRKSVLELVYVKKCVSTVIQEIGS